ncbi:MAG: extracellular solute-binding protein [Clostridiales bacterium]|jgi:ABC-type glycerol-3-phosphate transport system substrate-binding protein|nr:extracellular solute-binding protein [Clostridiales bacterium]
MLTLKKYLSTLTVFSLLIALLSSCGQSLGDEAGVASDTAAQVEAETQTEATEQTEASAPSDDAKDGSDGQSSDSPVISVFYTKGGAEKPPDNDAIHAEMEKQSGVKFEFISPPSANYTEQLHLMLASGDYPDITTFNLLTDPFVYAQDDILLDLKPYLDQMPNVVNYQDNTEAAMKFYDVDGKLIALPKTTSTKRYNMAIREDWINKLGLKIPATLDELHEVATAFVTQDPDGNGQNDTYAISGLGLDAFDYIFGAYGVILGETNWNAPNTHCNIYFKDVGGKLVPMVTLPEMKEAITLLNQWYVEGLIDPEFASQTDAICNEKYEQSRFGIATYWWAWEPLREAIMVQTIPDVKITRIAPPTGPTGISGMRAVPAVINGVSVMADTEYPELCVKFLDYLHTENGLMTSYTGVEGYHWELTDGKYLTTEQFNNDNKWTQWYFLFESEWPLHKVETHQVESRRDALKWNVVRDDADGIIVDAKLTYQADLQTLIAENFVNMITGQTSLDEFESIAEEFMLRGGQEWTDEVNSKYNPS